MTLQPEGWIPYEDRTLAERMETDAFHEQLGPFGATELPREELPERVIIHELEVKTIGKLLPRIWQTTGSCVGAGSGQAVAQAAVGDVALRGDHEEIKMSAWLVPYGYGRRKMRGRGSGSYGATQAKAVADLGILPIDFPRMPRPETRGGWIKFSSATELEWSYSPRWPIPESEIRPHSEKHQIGTVTRIQSTDQAKSLLVQAYSITLASSFGIRGKPSVKDDVLIGEWTGSWAHQMSCGGYWDHPTQGLIFQINNQWGPNAHGSCPTMSKIGAGVYGSFWIREPVFARIISRGEVYGHSNTEGFPKRRFVWDHGIAA